MILKIRINPTSCQELSVYLGHPVKEWTRYPEGDMDIDLDLASLTDTEKKTALAKLSLLGKRLIEGA